MQLVHLSDTRRLRFPARSEEFAHGVEIGMIAALMNMPLRNFTRRLATENLEQVRALAAKMGYRLAEGRAEGGWTDVAFQVGEAPLEEHPGPRPRLVLVHSAGSSRK